MKGIRISSIPEMISVLRTNTMVEGLAEYGSASYTDTDFPGDYDLLVVLNHTIDTVESLHCHIAGIPVDLNIRSLAQIESGTGVSGFEAILLEARLIYDRSGKTASALRELRRCHANNKPAQFSGSSSAPMRYGARHTFDKLRNRPEHPVVLKRFLLQQAVYWAVRNYFEVRDIPYYGDSRAFSFLKEKDPVLLENIDRFYASTDVAAQTELAYEILEQVLAPVGGMWQDNELLAFGDKERGREIFQSLFQSAM